MYVCMYQGVQTYHSVVFDQVTNNAHGIVQRSLRLLMNKTKVNPHIHTYILYILHPEPVYLNNHLVSSANEHGDRVGAMAVLDN